MKPEWLYFGCHQRSGHYLFRPGMHQTFIREFDKLTHFDGLLCPRDDRTPYVATVSRLGAWGLTALAFWDNTVDSRPGSNSVFYAPSLTITPEELITKTREMFPQVWARLPAITISEA